MGEKVLALNGLLCVHLIGPKLRDRETCDSEWGPF